jgi:hypothetical protein
MKALLALLGALAIASVANAGQTLRTLSWSELSTSGQLHQGRILPDGVLVLDADAGAEPTMPVFELTHLGVSTPVYAITGEVRCEQLGGSGYLEMWSHFPDGGAYFSRTLGTGPLAPLEGTSEWRPFVIPFYNRPGGPPPVRLSLGVQHPGGGRVSLRGVQLVQYAPGEDPLRIEGQRWSEREGGLVGGVAGSLIGLLGALVGMLGGAGRARGVVFGALRAMQGIGLATLVLGIVAVVRAQPYSVFYPLLLLGVLASVLPLALAPTLRKRYDGLEQARSAGPGSRP